MRTWVVITGVYAIETLFHFLWVIDSLVNPVPDTTADARVRSLNLLPVLFEVTDSVTHSVGILADEHRFVEVICILFHPSLSRVHLRVEVAEASTAVVAV